MHNIARAGLLSVVMLVAACGETINVNVECETKSGDSGPNVECTVKQTKGKGEVEACWDFKATCPNAVVVTALKNCQKVKGGGTETMIIPTEKLTNVNDCQGKPTVTLENLTLNGKKSK
jgi:hypothetical protein